MTYYKSLLEYVQVLEREGLLFRVNKPINKDTEMHPLVRWQYRGGIPEAADSELRAEAARAADARV